MNKRLKCFLLLTGLILCVVLGSLAAQGETTNTFLMRDREGNIRITGSDIASVEVKAVDDADVSGGSNYYVEIVFTEDGNSALPMLRRN